MKIDLRTFAAAAADLAGLRESQVDGLALLLRVVEREAFCDGVVAGRGYSYASEPREMHDEYENPKPKRVAAVAPAGIHDAAPPVTDEVMF